MQKRCFSLMYTWPQECSIGAWPITNGSWPLTEDNLWPSHSGWRFVCAH